MCFESTFFGPRILLGVASLIVNLKVYRYICFFDEDDTTGTTQKKLLYGCYFKPMVCAAGFFNFREKCY